MKLLELCADQNDYYFLSISFWWFLILLTHTVRLDGIDPAILRPGRFGKQLDVPLPSPDERGLILKALGRKMPIDASVDLTGIGRSDACKHFSGADLMALVGLYSIICFILFLPCVVPCSWSVIKRLYPVHESPACTYRCHVKIFA